MMGNKGSDDPAVKLGSGVLVGVVVLIAVVPKEVWIVLGIFAGILAVVGIFMWAFHERDERRAAAEERAREERIEKARKAKQQRIDTLGRPNAALVESALAAVKQIAASEASRAGWLGDVDFTADIQGITEKFQKAHALHKVTNKLAALDKPSIHDRKLLAEAKTAIANLERVAIESAELIERCATEATLVDKSLQAEREDARTAEQRAELHAKLSAMLYGIEAMPDTAPKDSAADGVMARVMAYREIKNQIQRVRDS
ncbi:hypothetical protein [Mycolicibacterium mengxianglii]|uniref:hypothetical protein n=1 Tax=Mycolicibacterium mengxianglii TaxID=2736649 RepID=UPI001E376BD0|nr:hypothetical protein [Mycolicibacterium mengxianglii]